MDREKIGENLKAAREALGLSIEEVAKPAGISPSAVYMYESGERIPRDEIKLKLSKILHVPIGFFYGQ